MNVILFDLDLPFQGQTSNVNISKTVKASAKLQDVTIFRFQHLPLNDIIVSVILFDLDLPFQGRIFQMLISRKR